MSRTRGDDGEGRKIFIGGLPFSADEDLIRDDFGKYGEIEDVYLPKERDTGKLRGFGFVTYRDTRDAQDASDDMTGRDYHGREITVNIAKPREADGRGGYHGSGGGRDRDRYEDRGRGDDRGYSDRGGGRRGGRDYDRDYSDRDRGYSDRDRGYSDRDRDYDRGDRGYSDRGSSGRDRDYDRRDYDRRDRDRDYDDDR
mmetsp:Transcript_5415/g.9062  ORF Transcript_5415/g.9062 Transcript_5415/m.9062 type:complete len:198 (+) Transcript_5415:32-625(+)